MRTITLDVPPQDVITRDNVSIKVNAVVYFRVMDAEFRRDRRGELSVCDIAARPDDAEKRLRSGGTGRDPLPAGEINLHLQEILDRSTGSWRSRFLWWK